MMNEQEDSLQDEKTEPKVAVNKTQKSELETPDDDASEKGQIEAEDEDSDNVDSKDSDSNDVEPDIDSLQYKIAVLSEALESAKDKSVRAQAEVENIRRRAANEQVNSRKFAIEAFASELLSVKDSLDLAEQVELSEDNKDVISKMQEGLTLTQKQLEQIFEKFSIKIISPEKGDKLNPELHQAMTIVPSDDVEPNCILDVIQKGYQLHDRLLRPAMVVIAKKTEEKNSESEQ